MVVFRLASNQMRLILTEVNTQNGTKMKQGRFQIHLFFHIHTECQNMNFLFALPFYSPVTFTRNISYSCNVPVLWQTNTCLHEIYIYLLLHSCIHNNSLLENNQTCAYTKISPNLFLSYIA